MKKISIFILIYFSFFASLAFSKMKFVTKNVSGSSFYVDFDNIKQKSGYIYYWGLTDYSQTKPSGTNSIKAFYELDCDLMRFKFIADHAYSGNMGTGKVEFNNTPDKEWSYYSPSSTGYLISQKVCDYTK